ncbi:MAG: type secretion system protein, partial [Nevskia sp.]|nr:type secretion system protein [Nevskia sp.]
MNIAAGRPGSDAGINQTGAPAAAPPTPKAHPAEGPLDLGRLLDELVIDGLLSVDLARPLRQRADDPSDRRHALIRIAERQWDNALLPGRKLSMEVLVQWLASKVGLPYLRIDPLSIEVSRVTTVVPYAYASRAKILPVKVTQSAVVIATSEPYQREWERDLGRALKLEIKR